MEIRTVLHAKPVDDTVCVSFTYPDTLSLESKPFLLDPGAARDGAKQLRKAADDAAQGRPQAAVPTVARDRTSLRVQEHDGSVQVEVIDLRNPQERRLLWRGFLEPDAARKAASDLEGAAAAAESQ